MANDSDLIQIRTVLETVIICCSGLALEKLGIKPI